MLYTALLRENFRNLKNRSGIYKTPKFISTPITFVLGLLILPFALLINLIDCLFVLTTSKMTQEEFYKITYKINEIIVPLLKEELGVDVPINITDKYVPKTAVDLIFENAFSNIKLFKSVNEKYGGCFYAGYNRIYIYTETLYETLFFKRHGDLIITYILTLSHEWRHAYQYNNGTSFNDYINMETNLDEYRKQEVERDAELFAARFTFKYYDRIKDLIK